MFALRRHMKNTRLRENAVSMQKY